MVSRKFLIFTAFLALSSSIAYGALWPVNYDTGVMAWVDNSGNDLSAVNLTNNSFRVRSIQYSLNGTGPWIVGNAQNFQQWLSEGYNDGYWTGKGYQTSYGASDPLKITGLNWCTGQEYLDMIGTTFHNITVNPGDIIGSYGYYGDMNFDGKVDQADISLFNMIYNQYPGDIDGINELFGTDYTAIGSILGDFNYDGYIDYEDYSLIHNVLSKGTPPYGILNQAIENVPEPSVILLLGMGVLGWLGNVVLRKKKGHG
ncbi:MAG: PEP-CTERM sorting domain-containing protein [Thermoguttaceae bacterium]